MAYPTGFAHEALPLSIVQLDQSGGETIALLQEAGFMVTAGVTRADVADIAEIAAQSPVREYCPNDLTKRFGTEALFEAWLQKNGGRGMFLLRQLGENAVNLAGYGWTGAEDCPELPVCNSTFAIRLNEDKRIAGHGLGKLFTSAIVSGSLALHGDQRIGLETWGSNTAAVRSYLGAGATLVTTRDDTRPTLRAEQQDEDGKRRDVRLFMQFTHTFA